MLVALTPEAVGAAPSSARPSTAQAERRLLDAIRRGDEGQAAQVYASLLPAVQATLSRVLGGVDRRHRELTQRSIERVIVELARHPSPWECRLHVWATAGAARVALDVLRARAGSHVPAPGSAVDRLRWLLAELPLQQAEAVVLCDVMGLEARDVAATAQVGVDHVRRLLAAGHQRLARQMALETSG
jgi:DNA-directed RNA polymerase specialized sigma24 family protein